MKDLDLINNDINLNLYKTFYNVAKYGNVTKTAEMTFTSQPAISRSIKKLESLLGVELFFRTIGGMELTEKGKTLFNCLESVYAKIIETEKNLKQLATFDKGKITIGIPSQIATFFLFNNIAKFHKLYPNINITIVSKTTSQLIDSLRKHQIDFIIDTSPINIKNDTYKIIPLLTVENCFVCLNTNENYGNIKSLIDLHDFPLILPIKNTANREALDKVFENHNINPKNIFNIHTSEMIIGAVKMGLGIGYVIQDLVKHELAIGELKKLNICENLPKTTINLVYEKNHLDDISSFFIRNYLNVEV